MKYIKNAEQLVETIRLFMKMHRSENYLDHLSFNEIMVCNVIVNNKTEENSDPHIQVKELSDKLKMSRPALNVVLNKLEDRGLIERIQIKGDRKSKYVKFTEKSHDIYNHEQEKLIKFFNNIVTDLGEEDTVKLIELLTKLYQTMDKEIKKC